MLIGILVGGVPGGGVSLDVSGSSRRARKVVL